MRWMLIGLVSVVAVVITLWSTRGLAQPKPVGFVSAFTVEVEPGNEQLFVERFQQRAQLVDKAKGFRGLFVLQHIRHANKFIVLTLWEDEASFRAWVNSEEFRTAHGKSNVPTVSTQLDTYRVRLSTQKLEGAAGQ